MESLGWTLCASVPRETITQSVHDSEDTIRNAILVFACVVLLILVLAVIAANRSVTSITHPLELLEKDIKIISNGDLSYRASVYRNDEIGDITSGMNEMVDRLNFTMNELASSQQHADEMSRLANLDTLTGIRNKTAFDRLQKALNEKLNEGDVDFGFAMVDMNNLKVVNDNYGHDRGDAMIRGLCEIIGETFTNSNAYRIGGDEFVVVLVKDDYRNVDELIDRFKARIRAVSGDKSLRPWERVSAAIGYALYNAHVDSGTESVLARADRAMYANKKDMKGGRR
jgi:diguanylate cyclase (GGDEF)-like protein